MLENPSEKQLIGLRKYIFEYVILCLTIAVIYLFTLYTQLNKFVTDSMARQQERMITVIEKNTAVIQNLKQ